MNKYHIVIELSEQTLYLREGSKDIKQYSVSTALNGPGEKIDSECTPRGKHVIAELIGESCQPNTVFVGRKATGEIFSSELRKKYPDRDWILTRIVRLAGSQKGINLGGNVDTYERNIYIHGSPDDVAMGQPGSHGCIRMNNKDLIELFNLLEPELPVIINQ